MKGEIEYHKDMARGAQAEALLSNELVVEAFETLERAYLKAFKESAAREAAGREELYRLLHSMERFRGHFKAIVDGGKIAQDALKQIAELGERRKRFGVI